MSTALNGFFASFVCRIFAQHVVRRRFREDQICVDDVERLDQVLPRFVNAIEYADGARIGGVVVQMGVRG